MPDQTRAESIIYEKCTQKTWRGSKTDPKSPLIWEKSPRFCNGYHFMASALGGTVFTGTTTRPKKLLRLPVPLFRSFWMLTSRSPGSEGSWIENSNCRKLNLKASVHKCRASYSLQFLRLKTLLVLNPSPIVTSRRKDTGHFSRVIQEVRGLRLGC